MQAAYDELFALCEVMRAWGREETLYLDFSLACDRNYYNGIVFRGYISGMPEAVLSGGRYDPLLRGMGRTAGALGFAVYLDQLERLGDEKAAIDVDVLILTDEETDPLQAARRAQEIIAGGETVRVQRKGAAGIRAGRTIDLTGEGAQA